jgi:hypothetical protein
LRLNISLTRILEAVKGWQRPWGLFRHYLNVEPLRYASDIFGFDEKYISLTSFRHSWCWEKDRFPVERDRRWANEVPLPRDMKNKFKKYKIRTKWAGLKLDNILIVLKIVLIYFII